MTAINDNSLARLSDSHIIKRLDFLVQKERETTLEVLRHIIEMDRRSLYLGRGYASLYEYCTRHLGYSESAAFRRIRTARCIRDFPEVFAMLQKNELNLTTVAKLAGILTHENKNALLSKKYPRGVSFEKLFEEILNEYLERHSPKRKIRRREKRKAKQKTQQGKLSNSEKTKKAKKAITRTTRNDPRKYEHSRHIPQAVQDKVFARDRGRCTFVGPDGVRCGSTWNLEIDHIKPFARGGSNSLQNLRLLCARHNNLEAERIYGKEFMQQRRCKAPPMR